MLRTAVRRKSWRTRPTTPAFLHADPRLPIDPNASPFPAVINAGRRGRSFRVAIRRGRGQGRRDLPRVDQPIEVHPIEEEFPEVPPSGQRDRDRRRVPVASRSRTVHGETRPRISSWFSRSRPRDQPGRVVESHEPPTCREPEDPADRGAVLVRSDPAHRGSEPERPRPRAGTGVRRRRGRVYVARGSRDVSTSPSHHRVRGAPPAAPVVSENSAGRDPVAGYGLNHGTIGP